MVKQILGWVSQQCWRAVYGGVCSYLLCQWVCKERKPLREKFSAYPLLLAKAMVSLTRFVSYLVLD